MLELVAEFMVSLLMTEFEIKADTLVCNSSSPDMMSSISPPDSSPDNSISGIGKITHFIYILGNVKCGSNTPD